jgi:Tfp pilus assembly protein PilP
MLISAIQQLGNLTLFKTTSTITTKKRDSSPPQASDQNNGLQPDNLRTREPDNNYNIYNNYNHCNPTNRQRAADNLTTRSRQQLQPLEQLQLFQPDNAKQTTRQPLTHFPIQNFEKILANKSSVVISPVISPR